MYQLSVLLQYFVHTFPIVEEHMKKAVGDTLFQLFMVSVPFLQVSMALRAQSVFHGCRDWTFFKKSSLQ